MAGSLGGLPGIFLIGVHPGDHALCMGKLFPTVYFAEECGVRWIRLMIVRCVIYVIPMTRGSCSACEVDFETMIQARMCPNLGSLSFFSPL